MQAPTRAHRGARFHSLHLDQRHPAGATSHAVASALKRPWCDVMRRRDAFTRALHVSTVRFPRAIQFAFQTIPQFKYSPDRVAFESLFGEAISAFDSKFGKKIRGRGQKCFCLVFFSADFGKSKNEIVLVAGEGKKDYVGERKRLLAGRRQRRDEEKRASAPQEPRTCCC